MPGVLVPGWGAVPGLYAAGVPAGWEVLEPPRYGPTGGELSAYRGWLGAEIARRDRPVSLAGHSMGAALAILAAADRPEAVDRLILLSPAGLPLDKPLGASLITFLGQICRGRYPWRELVRSVSGVARAPRAALALARSVHELDLTPECERLRTSSVALHGGRLHDRPPHDAGPLPASRSPARRGLRGGRRTRRPHLADHRAEAASRCARPAKDARS